MLDYTRSRELLCWKPILLLVLWCLAASSAWSQTSSPRAAQISDTGTCPYPVPTPTIPADPLLVQHTNFFCPVKIYDLKNDPQSRGSFPSGLNYKVYSAVGYDLANTMMLVGPDGGAVIIDTLGEEGSALSVISLFRRITRSLEHLPVKAIIYTHNHVDHIGGVEPFLKAMQPCPPQDPATVDDKPYTARTDCIEVLGQANIIDGVTQTATLSGAAINPRSAYMYGAYLGQQNGANRINDGIGPQVNSGTSAFRLPSRMFNQHLEFTVAGMTLQLVYVPSETNDELMVFVPDNKNGLPNSDGGLLFSAEVIQGPSFPNLYSLRGTSYRSPATWYKSVDTLRNFNSWCMVPSHGVPLCGANNIQTLLVNFRDAVQFTHDQTVRFMDQGFTPDELVEKVILPDYLIKNLLSLQPAMPRVDMDPRDYLREFYGSVRQAVREIYFGYLGWFPGDPVYLDPTPPVETAAAYIALIGKEKLQQEAQNALAQKHYQWAAELATLLIRVNHEDFAARKIKADAFRQLATTVTNPNWRNWYITSADELCFQPSGGSCAPFPRPPITGGLTSPGIVAALPSDKWVSSWTIWLEPNSGPQQVSLGLLFPEGDGFPKEQYVLQRDKAVVRFITGDSRDFKATWDGASVRVTITRPNLLKLLNNEADLIKKGNPTAFTQALQDGCYVTGQPAKLIQVTKGNCAGLKQFTEMFQQPPTQSPPLTIR